MNSFTGAGAIDIWFDRHDLCASFITSAPNYVSITDDIRVDVHTNKAGDIDSIQIFGQDTIGEEGVMHKSAVVDVDPAVTPTLDVGFTLVINQDGIPIYNCGDHLRCRKNGTLEYVGDMAIDLMIYTPLVP